MERLGYILPICSEDGQKVEVNPGTIAAGYQVHIFPQKSYSFVQPEFFQWS
jgi:hypothetical protein